MYHLLQKLSFFFLIVLCTSLKTVNAHTGGSASYALDFKLWRLAYTPGTWLKEATNYMRAYDAGLQKKLIGFSERAALESREFLNRKDEERILSNHHKFKESLNSGWYGSKASSQCMRYFRDTHDLLVARGTPWPQKINAYYNGDGNPFTIESLPEIKKLLMAMHYPKPLKDDAKGEVAQHGSKILQLLGKSLNYHIHFRTADDVRSNNIPESATIIIRKLKHEIDNLKGKYGEDIKFIFAFSHRHGITDSIVLAEIFHMLSKVDNPDSDEFYPHNVVMAAHSVMPAYFANKLAQSNSIIVPGGKKEFSQYGSATDKVIYLLNAGKIVNLGVFPDGREGVVNEVNVPRESFGNLIQMIRLKHPVAVVPINIEGPDGFLRPLRPWPKKREAQVTIDNVIPPEDVDFYMNMGSHGLGMRVYLHNFFRETTTKYLDLSEDEMYERLQMKWNYIGRGPENLEDQDAGFPNSGL